MSKKIMGFPSRRVAAFLAGMFIGFILMIVLALVGGCSALQTPQSKTQSSSIYAFGLPAVVITHGATQAADYAGGDSNSATQTSAPKGIETNE